MAEHYAVQGVSTTITGPAAGIIYLPVPVTGKLKRVDFYSGAANSAGDSVFDINYGPTRASVASIFTDPNLRPKIVSGALSGTVAGLGVSVARGGALTVDVDGAAPGGITAPLFFTCTIEDETPEALISGFYQGAFARPATSAELTSELTSFGSAKPTGVDYRRAAQDLGTRLFTSAEYTARNRTDAQFVDDLYAAYLARTGEEPARATYLNQVATAGRSVVRSAFAASEEFLLLRVARAYAPALSGADAHSIRGHKFSATAPTTGQGYAYNSTTGLFEPKDLSAPWLSTTDPTQAPTGLPPGQTALVFSQSSNKLFIWNGTEWRAVTTAATIVDLDFSTVSGTNLKLWFGARYLTGLTDGAAIASLANKGNAGGNWTNSTITERPTYRTNVVNGRPVLRFIGADSTKLKAGLGVGNFLTPATATMFIIYHVTAPGNATTLGYQQSGPFGDNATVWSLSHDAANPGNLKAYAYEANPGLQITTPYELNTFMLVELRHAGGVLTLRKGSATAVTGNVGDLATNFSGETYLGQANNGGGNNSVGLTGDIAEILLWNSSLSAADTTTVRNELARVYGVTV